MIKYFMLYRYIMDKVPTGPISIVSDSYDIFNMVEHIMGEELKEKVNITLFYVD